jgi:hypothetical protein
VAATDRHRDTAAPLRRTFSDGARASLRADISLPSALLLAGGARAREDRRRSVLARVSGAVTVIMMQDKAAQRRRSSLVYASRPPPPGQGHRGSVALPGPLSLSLSLTAAPSS